MNSSFRKTHHPVILRNLFFSAIVNFSDLLIVAVMIFAARKLGEKDFGILSYAQALAIIFLTPMNFGLGQIVVRNISKANELAGKYLFNLTWWRALLAVLSILALGFMVFFVSDHPPSTEAIIIIIGLASAFRFTAFNLRLFFRPLDLFNCEAMAVLIEQLLFLTFGLIILLMDKGLIYLATMFLIARFIGCCVSFGLIRRYVPFKFDKDIKLVIRIQKDALPIGISLLLTNLYIHVDTFIIEEMLGFGAVGSYNAALKIYMTSMMLPAIVSNVFLPQLSKSFSGKSKNIHNKQILYGIFGMIAVSVPVALVGALSSQWFIPFLFGSDFMTAARPTQILLIVTLPAFQVVFVRTLFVAVNRQNVLIVISLVGLAFRTVFDFLLIPRLGIAGAAIAVGISEIIILTSAWIYMLLYLFRIRSMLDVWQVLSRR